MTRPHGIVCVVGPTASGKSDVADILALRLGSSVVSFDSMQVYRGMDIGTAKVPVGERRRPLLMVDVVDPSEDFSAARYQELARPVVDNLLSNGESPVACGGTGLYLDALIDEMSFPSGGRETPSRSRWQALAEKVGAEELHSQLEARDPASAALIHKNNVRRVVRALELTDEGLSYAQEHEGFRKHVPHYDAALWGLRLDRETLYDRIDARVDRMMDQGFLEEVERLAQLGFADAITSRQAIGYTELLSVIDGTSTIENATSTIKARTRRYAKRQMTWFDRDGRVTWLDAQSQTPMQLAERILGANDAEANSHGAI